MKQFCQQRLQISQKMEGENTIRRPHGIAPTPRECSYLTSYTCRIRFSGEFSSVHGKTLSFAIEEAYRSTLNEQFTLLINSRINTSGVREQWHVSRYCMNKAPSTPPPKKKGESNEMEDKTERKVACSISIILFLQFPIA